MISTTRFTSLSIAVALCTLGASTPALAQQNPFGALPALVREVPRVLLGTNGLTGLPSLSRWPGASAEQQPTQEPTDEPAEQPIDEPAEQPVGAGRTFGIFIGVSQYNGENHDLPGSADDAVQLARAFEGAGWMSRSNAVVLTDSEASAVNVRQAFRTLAQRVRPGDTLVFFYDGHGNSTVLDTVGPDLSRGELGRLLRTVQGQQLVVLDSCEAGGFAPLVRGRADRAGLFSSRANENSQTAPEVNAGGWLAYFLRQAVSGGVSRGADGSVALSDVVSYVEGRYERQGITDRQHLVAVQPQGERFALGGNGTTVTPPPTEVGAQPTEVATAERGQGRNSPLAEALNTGFGLAGQVLSALTK